MSSSSSSSSWLTKTRGRLEDPRDYRNPGPGAASLEAMAMRSCLFNFRFFSRATIAQTPEYYCEMIGRRLEETNMLNLRDWAYLNARANLGDRKIHVREEKGSYPTLIKDMNVFFGTKSLGDFMTNLSVMQLNIDSEALFQISHITTLRVLMLEHFYSPRMDPNVGNIDQFVAVDDYVIRKWADDAKEHAYLPYLRVLGLRGFKMSYVALQALLGFPGLCIVNLTHEVLIGYSKNAIRRAKRKAEAEEYIPTFGTKHVFHSMGQQVDMSKFEPEETWKRLELMETGICQEFYNLSDNVHAPLRLLYKNALKVANKRGIDVSMDEKLPILSIHYGSESIAGTWLREACFWYMRVKGKVLVEKECPAETSGGGEGKDDGGKGGERKKRKMNEGKRQDVGSMLQGFVF